MMYSVLHVTQYVQTCYTSNNTSVEYLQFLFSICYQLFSTVCTHVTFCTCKIVVHIQMKFIIIGGTIIMSVAHILVLAEHLFF